MSDVPTRLVRPSHRGWAVMVPGARRSSAVHETRLDAVAAARRILRIRQGGVGEVQDADGDVVERIAVPATRGAHRADLRVR